MATKKPAEPTARMETFEVDHDGDTFVVVRNIDTGEQSVTKK